MIVIQHFINFNLINVTLRDVTFIPAFMGEIKNLKPFAVKIRQTPLTQCAFNPDQRGRKWSPAGKHPCC